MTILPTRPVSMRCGRPTELLKPSAFTVVMTTLLLLGLLRADAIAQPFYAVYGKASIPREPYNTWSLFLVTNQDWLVPEKAGHIVALYRRAEAFGRVIGRNHLAVWFWKTNQPGTCCEQVPNTKGLLENVDVERAIALCEKLGLRPSRGPYLLFTTTYPEENVAPDNYSVIELGKDPDEVDRLLSRLGDQLVVEGVVRNRSFASVAGSDDFCRLGSTQLDTRLRRSASDTAWSSERQRSPWKRDTDRSGRGQPASTSACARVFGFCR